MMSAVKVIKFYIFSMQGMKPCDKNVFLTVTIIVLLLVVGKFSVLCKKLGNILYVIVTDIYRHINQNKGFQLT